MFILFEGPEGGGKSTMATRLAQHFKELGRPVVHTVEPGGTPMGQAVRSILLNPESSLVSEAELLLFCASRAQLVRTVLKPALNEGKTVILDRYWLSTLAYQCAGRGLPFDPAHQVIQYATEGLMPHLTFVLDVEPEEGLRRTTLKHEGKLDRFEREEVDFHRKVREGFHHYGAFFRPLRIIDTTRMTPDAVFWKVVGDVKAINYTMAAVSA